MRVFYTFKTGQISNPVNNLGLGLLSIMLAMILSACGGGGGDGGGGGVINTPPTVNAGTDQSVVEGDAVQLAGTGSDTEGAVTFAWTQTSGVAVTLSATNIANPAFTAPQVDSTQVLQFMLTVTDSDGASVTDVVVITVTATGGGGGGGGGGAASSTYLFYSNSLNALDPATPTSPTLIEPAGNIVSDLFSIYSAVAIIKTGSYDGSTKIVSNITSYAVIYAKNDGRLYRISALKSGSLNPVQVSNENQADQLCMGAMHGRAVRTDFVNVENSQYLYALPGADNTCQTDDDVWKMVRLGMSATDAPILAKHPVADIINFNTGALIAWLVKDGNALSRCDANFSGCVAIAPVATSVDMRLNIGVTDVRLLLEIDDQLFIYTSASNTLSSSVFTRSAGTSNTSAVSDGNDVYFGNGISVYKFPADGSMVATELAAETSTIQLVELTSNKVVYQIETEGVGQELKSMPKTGGTPLSLATATGANNLFLMFVAGDKLYYDIRTTTNNSGELSITPIAAGVVDENGNNQAETTNAAWIGGVYSTTSDFSKAGNQSILIEKVFRAEGFNLGGTNNGFAGATLISVDSLTAIDGVTMGTLPSGEKLVNILCFGAANNTLCGVLVGLTPVPAPPTLPFQNDIFYLSATTVNSLVRVTNTQDENEILLIN